ncbi:MAG: lecithin retinol acyltransferase family protein [Oscillospiraceae bacterium]
MSDYDDYDDYDEYDEECEDDYDDEESLSDILEESSRSWNEMFAEFRQEFAELFEEYDEVSSDYDIEDDPELMQEEIAMQNVRLFAGMLINAGTSIGNFLSASAKFSSGELPAVHLHNESEKQVEDTYKAGEHLRIERGVYTHHGIYVGGGKVIHYSQGYDSVPEIREVSFKEFAGISKVDIVPERDSPLRFSADEAVKRAYSRLGERNYNLVYNNCENFVRWCRAGC